MQKRIKEIVDSNGNSKFIPQYKFFGLFWKGFEGYPCGDITFDDFERCKNWLLYEANVMEKIHEISMRLRAAHPNERLVMLQNSLQTLRDLTQGQCSDGNWNYDPYMHGMANGMIFALSLFDDKEPEYLEAPEQWLKDLPDTDLKTVEAVTT